MKRQRKQSSMKSIQSMMRTLCKHIDGNYILDFLIPNYNELMEKIQKGIAEYGSLNVELNEYNRINAKFFEFAESNTEAKAKLQKSIKIAKTAGQSLKQMKRVKKFKEMHPIIKNYHELSRKSLSFVECCGKIYSSSCSMYLHIQKSHPETYVADSKLESLPSTSEDCASLQQPLSSTPGDCTLLQQPLPF